MADFVQKVAAAGAGDMGAPVKADRLDVTEREAVEAYADAVDTHFGAVNQIYKSRASRLWATSRSPSSKTSSG